jgi:putrescine---pyruvate transaminase
MLTARHDYQAADRNHHIHPKTNPKLHLQNGGVMITRAKGVYVWDDRNIALIDGVAGLASVNVGYGHPRLCEAITKQLETLSFFHTFTGFANPASSMLSEKLAQIMPDNINRFYYTSSGSEAVDTVIKFAHFYWKCLGKPQKRITISRDRSYHGSTFMAAALTGMSEYHTQFHVPTENVRRIEAPDHYNNAPDMDEEDYGRFAASKLRDQIEAVGAENVAAFIGEPMMVSGGAIVAPKGYWQEIRKICDDYDILLIIDDVITGFGRLGHWLGGSEYGENGDIVSMAKGISSSYVPMGAVGLSDKVADVIQCADEYFMHGFSSTGNPVAAAATLANIAIIEDEMLLEAVRTGPGQKLRDGIYALASNPLVSNVRGVGMAVAFDLEPQNVGITSGVAADYPGAVMTVICRNLGLIVRGNEKGTFLSPPLTASNHEIAVILEILNSALKAFPFAAATL